MDDERDVGGLRCSQVLEGLSAYVDGELAPEMVAKVEAHLEGCENCARFGAEFTAALGRLHGLRPSEEADRASLAADRAHVMAMLERIGSASTPIDD